MAARLATAAAGLAWAAILLMCAALVGGQGGLFIKDTLPPPVRIYCRQDPVLNVAVRDGEVVLARAACSDLSQKWHMVPAASTGPGPNPFALMNAKTGQVITIPSGNGSPVGLSSSQSQGAQALLRDAWTAEKPTRRDLFSRLFVNRDKRFTLVAQRTPQGRVEVGSRIRVYSSVSANSENALWQVTSYPLCIDPNNPNP